MADGPLKKRVVPSPNTAGYGKHWLWDETKEQAVELLAKGFSYKKTATALGVSANALRDWFRIPEFAQAVDKEIMDTGMAAKNNRVAIMKSMADSLLGIFELKIEELIRSTQSERIKDISSEIRDLLKQIAQEKQEYVEISRQEHIGEVNITTSIGDIEAYLTGLKSDKRQALEQEFAQVADAVVASITQGLPQKPLTKPEKKDE